MLNPTIAVCREEALGVAKEERHLEMAAKCHEFLVRHGYINFGCILASRPLSRPEDLFTTKPSKERKRVVVIGAGAAGLGCARQLEGLFVQFADRFSRNEDLPEVILLEGRNRVGGRIYSHPLTPPTVSERPASSSLSNSKSSTLSSVSSVSRISSSSSLQASFQRLPDPVVDLGAQIVTGFENGNPLAPIIKRQLRLRWHHLHDDSLLFNDQDGARVDTSEDQRAEKLFNDILDRASAFKEKVKDNYLIEGDRELMDQGREPHGESGRQIAKVEENEAVLPPMPPSPPLSPKVDSTDSGHPSPRPGGRKLRIPARRSLTKMGFQLKDSDTTIRKGRLDEISVNSTLGITMKTILGDILELVDLNPMDMKLLNWHWANLEYGNATNLNNLSLKYWDQDDGNEYYCSLNEPNHSRFLGAHAMILGGYGQFANGLASFPTKLNIRYNQRVQKIRYGKSQDSTLVDVDESPVTVVCDDGSSIRADAVVVTSSLGVLKSSMMQFDPELPAEKTAAISRLGFGLLNKVTS
jgi:Flavin containing amine oxidoreductase/NAD(P)-binding Rossmann-like domain